MTGRRGMLGGAALLILTLAAFWATGLIDLSFASELETFTGPRAYPQIILSVMLGLSVLLMVRAALALVVSDEHGPGNRRGVVATVGLLVGFVALFEPLGYILAMPCLVFAAALLVGARRLGSAALVAIVSSLLCLLLFRYGLNTVLPEGVLGIDQIF